MLMRFDPFRFDPFRELDRELDRLTGRPSSMPMDAYRRGDRVEARFDLPGIDPASLDVTVEKNVLTVSAQRTTGDLDGAEVLVSERPTGTFTRRLFLGESLDVEHLEARYADGVLSVTVPVAERAKARRIEVATGAAPVLDASVA